MGDVVVTGLIGMFSEYLSMSSVNKASSIDTLPLSWWWMVMTGMKDTLSSL
jgi:hypothetical protein